MQGFDGDLEMGRSSCFYCSAHLSASCNSEPVWWMEQSIGAWTSCRSGCRRRESVMKYYKLPSSEIACFCHNVVNVGK